MKRRRKGVLDKGNGLCQRAQKKNTRAGPGQLVPGAGSVVCRLERIKEDLHQGLDLGLPKMPKAESI